jgi:hypothetical protein
MRYLTAVFSLGIFAALLIACEKPKTTSIPDLSTGQYMSFAISLNDTIPEKSISTLQLKAKVDGYKIRYLTGEERRYFVYDAEPDKLIQAFREMAFDLTNLRTDVDLRMVAFEDMKSADDYAPNESDDFWGIEPAEYYAFECLKAGIKHQVLVHKASHRVLHRVVYA